VLSFYVFSYSDTSQGETLPASASLLDTTVASLLVAYEPGEVKTPESVAFCENALALIMELALQYLGEATPATQLYLGITTIIL
jgi:hypothetical protein